MPFTLQLTLVLVVLVTVAVSVNWFPSRTVLTGEVTVTVMEGGGGGCGATVPPALQPDNQAAAERRAAKTALTALDSFLSLCGRGRMPSREQAKDQRKKNRHLCRRKPGATSSVRKSVRNKGFRCNESLLRRDLAAIA